MRGSKACAADSISRAAAIRVAGSNGRSRGSKSSRSGSSPAKPPSGRPAHGSGAVARASATASAAVRAITSRERSCVRVDAEDKPQRPP